MDTCSPFQEFTYDGKRYFLCMTTTQHYYIPAIPILNKSDMHEGCLELIASLERNSKSTVNRIHCSNTKKYLSMRKFLNQMGIIMTTSSPYSLQFIALFEQLKRTLMYDVWAVMNGGDSIIVIGVWLYIKQYVCIIEQLHQCWSLGRHTNGSWEKFTIIAMYVHSAVQRIYTIQSLIVVQNLTITQTSVYTYG